MKASEARLIAALDRPPADLRLYLLHGPDEATAQAQFQAHEEAASQGEAGADGRGRRVLVHASGFRQSPYADIKPAGGDVQGSRSLAGGKVVPEEFTAPRKLWHSSPGSSGH